MRTLRLSLLITLLLPLAACKKTELTDATDAKYKVGQRWNYWARIGEEQSTFTIVKIESHPKLGFIVHVGLDNLKLKTKSGSTGILPHLPMAREALDKSATKMVEDGAPLPNYQQGYQEWKKAVDDGKGLIYTVPIAESLAQIEQAAGS
jgi:hypothetical protein